MLTGLGQLYQKMESNLGVTEALFDRKNIILLIEKVLPSLFFSLPYLTFFVSFIFLFSLLAQIYAIPVDRSSDF